MNKKELSLEIARIVSKLRELGREDFALEIEKNWQKSAIEYSSYINTYEPSSPMEEYLKNAFDSELKRLDYTHEDRTKIIKDLEKYRIMQTAPHLIPSNGPRMFFIDWLSSLELNSRKYYVVGMYSGIPFSNSFYPGHISFNTKFELDKIIDKTTKEYAEINKIEKIKNKNDKERKISIIPSKIQDDLVYRSGVSEKTINTMSSLTAEIKKYFHIPSLLENDYTKWSLQAQNKINSDVLKRNDLVYLDMNEVVSTYLFEICDQKEHIVYKILFNKETRDTFEKNFKDEKLFTIPYSSGKFTDNESLSIKDDYLMGEKTNVRLDPEIIRQNLKLNRLCPSAFTCFMVLVFINNFKCLGSFRQAVYLPEYKKKWIQSNLLTNEVVEKIPCCNVTTGYFNAEKMNNVRPLDIILGMEHLPNTETLFGDIVLTVEENLYF